MRRRPAVQVVTSAHRSASEDVAARQRRYLYAMTVRTTALILAIFVLHGWVRFVALVLGMLLPWVSVTSANTGPLPEHDPAPTPEPLAPAQTPRALPPAAGRTIDMEP